MKKYIRNQKDFCAGAIYLAFGIAALWMGTEYHMGTASRMGPGYFPAILGALLTLFGLVSVLRSVVVPGPEVTAIAWKPFAVITASVVAFALLLQPVGLVLSLLLLVAASAWGSSKFELNRVMVLYIVGLVAGCALVFVVGLGVPMPLFGSVFTG